jgi:hypothetical protein
VTASQTAWERFLRQVDLSGDCWLWVGTKQTKGYGQFWFNGRGVLAHRWLHEEMYGPISDDMTVDHTCGTKTCVNPAHMEIVSRAENSRRRHERINAELARLTELASVAVLLGVTPAQVLEAVSD